MNGGDKVGQPVLTSTICLLGKGWGLLVALGGVQPTGMNVFLLFIVLTQSSERLSFPSDMPTSPNTEN
jgi:hypothetical protein